MHRLSIKKSLSKPYIKVLTIVLEHQNGIYCVKNDNREEKKLRSGGYCIETRSKAKPYFRRAVIQS